VPRLALNREVDVEDAFWFDGRQKASRAGSMGGAFGRWRGAEDTLEA
jgi:hypothetical protein